MRPYTIINPDETVRTPSCGVALQTLRGICNQFNSMPASRREQRSNLAPYSVQHEQGCSQDSLSDHMHVVVIQDNTRTEAILSKSNIQFGLRDLVRDTFQCCIFYATSPMNTPPILFAQCCKHILGCEECVNQWYSGPVSQENSMLVN